LIRDDGRLVRGHFGYVLKGLWEVERGILEAEYDWYYSIKEEVVTTT
jgi:hypothetical protein